MPNLGLPGISYEHWHRYLFASDFAQGKDVLDIACGEGYGSDLLASAARTVLGVDIDASSVRHAAYTYQRSNLKFECGAAEAIPVALRHVFDLIVSFETVEHLSRAQQAKFFSEIKRLLKPDGILIISTPNRDLYGRFSRRPNRFHIDEFRESEFSDFLRSYFEYVQLYGQHVYPASYIWPAVASTSPVREYQIKFANGRFEPTASDEKERYYLIAVCSDASLANIPESLLLDLTQVSSRYDSFKRMNLQQLTRMSKLRLKGTTLSFAARVRSRIRFNEWWS